MACSRRRLTHGSEPRAHRSCAVSGHARTKCGTAGRTSRSHPPALHCGLEGEVLQEVAMSTTKPVNLDAARKLASESERPVRL